MVEILEVLGIVLIVGAYFLNINGKIKSTSSAYIVCNLIGGIFCCIYSFVHRTYPGMLVNITWVIIAAAAILKKK